MRDFRDAKVMAQTLREALKSKSVNLTHGECLELVAKSFGLQDWNVMAARIQATQPVSSAPTNAATPADKVPLIPLRDAVFFPQMVAPLFIGRDKSKRAADAALAADRLLFVVTQRLPGDDDPDFSALYPVGVTATIINGMTLPDGSLKLLVSCLERRTVGRANTDNFLAAEALPFSETRGDTEEAAKLSRAVLEKYMAGAKPAEGYAGLARLPGIETPGLLTDTVAPFLLAKIEQKQQILETGDIVARLEAILQVMRNQPPASADA